MSLASPLRAPPPWTLHGEAHALLLWLPGAGTSSPAEGVRVRTGGLGVLALVRYAQSDVGAYDELLWLSPWGLRMGTRRLHTVPRIFVSTEASRSNGRRNWGIPKELARFEVEAAGTAAQRFRVSTSVGLVATFVATSLRRSIGIDAGALPAPLRRLGQVLGSQLFEMAPSVRGQLHAARFSELRTDPTTFVDVSRGRALGACSLYNFDMTFPEALVTSLARERPAKGRITPAPPSSGT
jgi:hypothetical protein